MSESKLEGNWQAVLKKMDKIGDDVLEAAKLALHQNALVLERTIVKHFERQDLGWPKLNPAYKKYKTKRGLSNQVLIATSTLMQSITTQLSADGTEAFVGVLRTAPRKDGKKPVMIAAVHEYGSTKRKIKKRPFLEPSFKEKQQEFAKRYETKISEALAKVGR